MHGVPGLLIFGHDSWKLTFIMDVGMSIWFYFSGAPLLFALAEVDLSACRFLMDKAYSCVPLLDFIFSLTLVFDT